MLYEVYVGKHSIGIKESNYEFAKKHWEERSRISGIPFKLVEVPAVTIIKRKDATNCN